jgi:hypothetical protein
VRFGNPINALAMLQPGALVGQVKSNGSPQTSILLSPLIVPAGTRSIMLLGTNQLPVGASVSCQFVDGTAQVFPLPPSPLQPNGALTFRVPSEITVSYSLTVSFPVATVLAGTVLAEVLALTDPGAVGVFQVPGSPVIGAVPQGLPGSGTSADIAFVVGLPGGNTTNIVAPVTGRSIRIWSSTVGTWEQTAGVAASCRITSSVSGRLIAAAVSVGPQGVYCAGVGGGVILPVSEGVKVTTGGAGASGDAAVVYDFAS